MLSLSATLAVAVVQLRVNVDGQLFEGALAGSRHAPALGRHGVDGRVADQVRALGPFRVIGTRLSRVLHVAVERLRAIP